jgi:hypothetical protein
MVASPRLSRQLLCKNSSDVIFGVRLQWPLCKVVVLAVSCVIACYQVCKLSSPPHNCSALLFFVCLGFDISDSILILIAFIMFVSTSQGILVIYFIQKRWSFKITLNVCRPFPIYFGSTGVWVQSLVLYPFSYAPNPVLPL